MSTAERRQSIFLIGRVATLPVGRAATRVPEVSRALSFGETARERPDAAFESDSVDDVDRPAAAVDFPD
jgi:hypothetical protein